MVKLKNICIQDNLMDGGNFMNTRSYNSVNIATLYLLSELSCFNKVISEVTIVENENQDELIDMINHNLSKYSKDNGTTVKFNIISEEDCYLRNIHVNDGWRNAIGGIVICKDLYIHYVNPSNFKYSDLIYTSILMYADTYKIKPFSPESILYNVKFYVPEIDCRYGDGSRKLLEAISNKMCLPSSAFSFKDNQKCIFEFLNYLYS